MGSIVLGAVAIVFMFALVVGIHELGHFATAKWSGIRVDEFALGMGPRVFSRTRGETVYSIRALPVGGFVKMPGMSALEEDDGGPRGFMNARLHKQVIVLVAGVTMNFLLAGLLFGILKTQGYSSALTPGLAASAAGLKDGDEIVAAGGVAIDTSNSDAVATSLRRLTDTSQGRPVAVTVRTTAGAVRDLMLQPAIMVFSLDDSQHITAANGVETGGLIVSTVNGHPVGTGDPATVLGSGGAVHLTGYVGSSPGDPANTVDVTLHGIADGRGGAIGKVQAAWYIGYAAPVHGESLPMALLHGYTTLPSNVANRVKDIWDVVTTPNSGGIKNFQGPVGIAHNTSDAVNAGWDRYVGIIALVSLSLGLVNILPIPPFDGGRLVLSIGQAFRRKGSGARVELALVGVGVVAVATLAVLITINDIKGF